jgi:cytochrome P450
MMVEGTKSAFGEGIVFSEGDIWKKKRKLLSKVFNFDLIQENIPKISEICDRCLNDFDEGNKTGDKQYKYDTLKLSSRIFNGVVMKCFFGSDQVNEKIEDLTYE